MQMFLINIFIRSLLKSMRINYSHLSRLKHLKPVTSRLKNIFTMSSIQYVSIVVFCVIIVTSGKPADSFIESLSSKSVINSNKFGTEQIYESMPQCTTRKHFINPDDLIKSSGADYTFDQNFSQKIQVELCENEGAPCSDDSKVKTRCRQRFLTIQLQVISKNKTESEPKSFRIPSNCECSYLKFRN